MTDGTAEGTTEAVQTTGTDCADVATHLADWLGLPDPEDTGDEDGWGEEQAPGPEPYRDGKVHVMKDKCSTCVFRPGNLMHLSPGRLKDMSDYVKETGVPFSCHQTLPYSERHYQDHYGGAALCAGAVEAHGDESLVLRMAHAMDIIEEVEPYPGDGGTEDLR